MTRHRPDPLTAARLERWELFGGRWRVVRLDDERVVVELDTCDGRLEERLESVDPDVIAEVRRQRPE